MTAHADIAVAADCAIYFCDPHSPWQRASNENTNGLLRQYFPKGTDLAAHSPQHLAAVADELNGGPRKTLGWKTPAEAMAELPGQPGRLSAGERAARQRRAASAAAHSRGWPRMVRGRPPGLKAAHAPLRGGLRPAWTPETSAAPGRQEPRARHSLPPALRAAPRPSRPGVW